MKKPLFSYEDIKKKKLEMQEKMEEHQNVKQLKAKALKDSNRILKENIIILKDRLKLVFDDK